ncbi:MAG: hypothetical protein M1831_002641 [Alyxoria varia]|nr:MAG: hypothetical protein M1831_002641 [Alyxoria varia]
MSINNDVPRSIIICGSGVFGLSTLYELLQRPRYERTRFILLSPSLPSNLAKIHTGPTCTSGKPGSDRNLIASVDTSRIIRGDYADPDTAALAREAQTLWRGEWGAEGRYHESGLLLTADEGTKGAAYVKKSLENGRQSDNVSWIKGLNNSSEVAGAMRERSEDAMGIGNVGYLNGRSGWADAGAAMELLLKKVVELSRGRKVKLVRAAAERFYQNKGTKRVKGVSTSAGEVLAADLMIVATGAWTPTLVETGGIASARGQCVAYVDITKDEAERLKNLPVHLNLSSGCFVFPPTKRADGGGWEIKVARHSYGYSNPVDIPPRTVGKLIRTEITRVSVPSFPDTLPPRDEKMLLDFLASALPILRKAESDSTSEHASSTHGLSHRRIRSRMCWYLDTHSGDYLVCPHPQFPGSLFLATGGSGHAFKFLPALGRHIVDVLDGTDEKENGGAWTRRWAWPERQKEDEVWCQDGSRAGEPGRELRAAFVTERSNL